MAQAPRSGEFQRPPSQKGRGDHVGAGSGRVLEMPSAPPHVSASVRLTYAPTVSTGLEAALAEVAAGHQHTAWTSVRPGLHVISLLRKPALKDIPPKRLGFQQPPHPFSLRCGEIKGHEVLADGPRPLLPPAAP